MYEYQILRNSEIHINTSYFSSNLCLSNLQNSFLQVFTKANMAKYHKWVSVK